MLKNIWFTSDTHYGHKNIISHSKRPYSSVEEMNEALIEQHNNCVKKDDILYFLGDFAFGSPTFSRQIFERLQGKKCLIPGNHDPKSIYSLGWDCVYPSLASLKIDGIYTVLCHFPILSWDQAFHGSFHFHGHSHNRIPFDDINRRIDVGVDAWGYRPVNWEELKEKLLSIPTLRDRHIKESSEAN